MKKLLSIMLALILVFSMATVAFADSSEVTPEWDGTYKASDPVTFDEILKTYTLEGGVTVSETLSFTAKPDSANPVNTNLTVNNLVVTGASQNLSVTIPSLTKAGTYRWTITENAGNTAGVTYSDAIVHVIALVEYDNDNHKLVVKSMESYIEKIGGQKAKTFENAFNTGSFTVKKDVIGNMANETDEFEITVTLTSTKPIGSTIKVAGQPVTAWTEVKDDDGTVTSYTYTTTLTLSEMAGATTFSDIPVGVTVTVKENTAAEKMNGYTYVGTYTNYIVTDNNVQDGATEFTGLTVADETNTDITVVNNKTTTIDTGITLDSVPYFLMLSIACVGMFLLLSKKRANREY